MPYRKERSKRKQLSPEAVAYLSDDDTGLDANHDDFTLWCYRTGQEGFAGDPKPDELWAKYKDEFLPAYIEKHPGRRSLAWWQWDAPRHDTGTGAYFEPLPIPRRRLGGTGQAMAEKYPAYVPTFERGIPSGWYVIDPSDPPQFEAEAVFLERHGLLTPQEKAYLKKHPELLEPEKIKMEVEENANAS